MPGRPFLPALAGTLALALSACASAPPRAPRVVRVPVPVRCTARMPLAPLLPLQSIGPRSTDAEVARAYVGSIVELKGYADQLSRLLVACISGGRHPRAPARARSAHPSPARTRNPAS